MSSLFPGLNPATVNPPKANPKPNGARVNNGMLIGQSVATVATPAGPNAFEVGVVSYDPDAGIVNVRVTDSSQAEVAECTVELEKMTGCGIIDLHLGEGKLSPRIEIRIYPRVKPPKFASVEEAEKWMEEFA